MSKAKADLAAAEADIESLPPYEPPRDKMVRFLKMPDSLNGSLSYFIST